MTRKSLSSGESSESDEWGGHLEGSQWRGHLDSGEQSDPDEDTFDSCSSSESDDSKGHPSERDGESNIKRINEYIEKLDILRNKCDLKIRLNQQKEKENLLSNIDNINIQVKKHLLFKGKINKINNSLREKCNYDAFSQMEKIYKTISNVNSSYEYITLKIQLQDYIRQVEGCVRRNYLDAIEPLNQFLQVRRCLYRYGRSELLRGGSSLNGGIASGHGYHSKGAVALLTSEDAIIESDIIKYVQQREKQLSEDHPEQNNDAHPHSHAEAQAYAQIFQTDEENVKLLNGYYDHVKGLIEDEIGECIKLKDVDGVRAKVGLYLSIFRTRGDKRKQNDQNEQREKKTDSSQGGGEGGDEGSDEESRHKGSGVGSHDEASEVGSHDEASGVSSHDEENRVGSDSSDRGDEHHGGGPPADVALEDQLLYFGEYLFVCRMAMKLVELEVEKKLELLTRQVVSTEDSVYVECIKGTYTCLYRHNAFLETLLGDHIVCIIYNRKAELIFNRVVKSICSSFCSQAEVLRIDNYNELTKLDKNVEMLSLLCYHFQNIKKFLHQLGEEKFRRLDAMFVLASWINKEIFSDQSGLFKNLPYVKCIQDCLCSYIDYEILFTKHCIDKAFVLTDDIMLSLIDDEKSKGKDARDFYENMVNFEHIMMSSSNSNEYTSTLLDDAFFIFQKSVCRSINMKDINTMCVLVNHIILFIGSTLKRYLSENLKTSKSIYAAFIHEVGNLKPFSFRGLLSSIDETNYMDEGQGNNRTVALAQNLVSSLSYVRSEAPEGVAGRNDHASGSAGRNNAIRGGGGGDTSVSSEVKGSGKGSRSGKGMGNDRGIYDYLTAEHYESLFNPLSDRKNMDSQTINSKFSYPHCVNNIDSCHQYIQNFKHFIHDYFVDNFLKDEGEKKERGRHKGRHKEKKQEKKQEKQTEKQKQTERQNYLLMFANSFANYENLLIDFEKLSVENCKNLLNILKVHFIGQLVVIESVNFDITSEQYAYYQLNDPYINGLVSRMKLIVYHISLYFNQNIFQICVGLLAEKICKYIERIVRTKKFSLYGCVQLDNDIRNLMLFFTSLTSINVKKEFSKLLEICELLNINDLQDFKDFYEENKNNLSSSEVEEIISMRNDISEELLGAIKLYMNWGAS
ncbi:hypothetical protein C922_00872 [Plasmodium inui San Antonio 1]|uniref:Conserved oligomeric Golgi complex subunit 4 C-terminal domain-containing protein n=1 Tax=Plasmodium inui San Antonio 1 TaxID=1237626 RepID=W7ASN0_9APIC|nr:hypothetical protein C922_00872 [Plasmodium inui San Antonio 1]EUD68476.1 hypothetical protein C922_00872 [Plasmodium inui San Antonio 1]